MTYKYQEAGIRFERGENVEDIARKLGITIGTTGHYIAKFKNPELYDEQRIRYQKSNKGRKNAREYAKVWRKRNPIRYKRTQIRNNYGEEALARLDEVGWKCEKCGYDKHPEVHHINWDKSCNKKENFSILCRVCHHKLHEYIPVENEMKVNWHKQFMEGE